MPRGNSMKLLKNIFLPGRPNIKIIMEKNATIIDVRSWEEFTAGHLRGAMNIPLEVLEQQLAKLNPGIPLLVCCSSGIKSAAACKILKAHGFTHVYDGGNWLDLKKYIPESLHHCQ